MKFAKFHVMISDGHTEYNVSYKVVILSTVFLIHMVIAELTLIVERIKIPPVTNLSIILGLQLKIFWWWFTVIRIMFEKELWCDGAWNSFIECKENVGMLWVEINKDNWENKSESNST